MSIAIWHIIGNRFGINHIKSIRSISNKVKEFNFVMQLHCGFVKEYIYVVS